MGRTTWIASRIGKIAGRGLAWGNLMFSHRAVCDVDTELLEMVKPALQGVLLVWVQRFMLQKETSAAWWGCRESVGAGEQPPGMAA